MLIGMLWFIVWIVNIINLAISRLSTLMSKCQPSTQSINVQYERISSIIMMDRKQVWSLAIFQQITRNQSDYLENNDFRLRLCFHQHSRFHSHFILSTITNLYLATLQYYHMSEDCILNDDSSFYTVMKIQAQESEHCVDTQKNPKRYSQLLSFNQIARDVLKEGDLEKIRSCQEGDLLKMIEEEIQHE